MDRRTKVTSLPMGLDMSTYATSSWLAVRLFMIEYVRPDRVGPRPRSSSNPGRPGAGSGRSNTLRSNSRSESRPKLKKLGYFYTSGWQCINIHV